MTELGQLNTRHEDFGKRNVRIVVVSIQGPEESQQTQQDFPNLVVATDEDRRLSELFEVIHEGSNPTEGGILDAGDTSAPTTILVDGQGIVRWWHRPDRYLERLSPDEMLAEIDKHLGRRMKDEG